MTSLPERQPLVERDATEVLTPEDQAARHAELQLQAALANHAHAARQTPQPVPGCCANCGEACHPLAVYCDADCRADHEDRLKARQRNGKGLA